MIDIKTGCSKFPLPATSESVEKRLNSIRENAIGRSMITGTGAEPSTRVWTRRRHLLLSGGLRKQETAGFPTRQVFF